MKRSPTKESAPILKFDNGIGVGTPVTKSWMFELSWKEQTVLITGLRGPDGLASEGMRDIVRWIRHTLLNDADPTSGYMIDVIRPDWKMGPDLGPVHFLEHLLLCLKIIERRHPEESSRAQAEFLRARVKLVFKGSLAEGETREDHGDGTRP